MCVPIFTCILEKKVHLLCLFLYLQILAAKITPLRCVFPAFLDIICHIEIFKKQISKKARVSH